MGQEFAHGNALSIADKLLDKVDRTIDIIDNAPANMHQKFVFVSLIATS